MLTVVALALLACSGGEAPTPAPAPPPAPAKAKQKAAPKPAARPDKPLPSIIVTQAWFKNNKPQPAKMVVYAKDGDTWHQEKVLDKDSNVFHKGMAWRDGILTIGAMKAMAKHWKRGEGGKWSAETIWEQSWGGKFETAIEVANEKRIACPWAITMMHLFWDGRVPRCPGDTEGEEAAGNAWDDTLTDLWAKLSGYRQLHLDHKFGELPERCDKCTDWKTGASVKLRPDRADSLERLRAFR